MLTTVGTHVIGFQYPPAYATTLIVSRGVLTGPAGVGFFLVALLVVSLHETVGKRLLFGTSRTSATMRTT